MNPGAEVIPARKPSFLVLEQRRAGETNHHHTFAHNLLHRFVQNASLGTVALIHEDEDVALCRESFWQFLRQITEILLRRTGATELTVAPFLFLRIIRNTELMNQCTNERRHFLLTTAIILALQHLDEMVPTLCPDRMLSCILEAILNLLIQLIPVGDNHHAAVIDILPNPLRKPNHREALSGALGMPDNTALLVLDAHLGGHDGKVLVWPGDFLHAAVIHNTVVDKLQQPVWLQHLNKGAVQFIRKLLLSVHRIGDGIFQIVIRITFTSGFFPVEVELWRSQRSTVVNALALAARHQELHCGEELRNLAFLLVAPVLVDAILNAHRGLFQFDDAKGNAVHINDDIRPAVLFARSLLADGDFLGYIEIVVARIIPVDKPGLFVWKAGSLTDGNWVPQGIVHGFIAVIESILVGAERRLLQFADGFCSLGTGEIHLIREELAQKIFTDVAVLALFEIAYVLVAVVFVQEFDNPVLDGTFGVGGRIYHIRRVLPVNSSCIIPCFMRAYFSL